MDLLQLKYFCAIVEEGHMTRAAARLSIAQPALSASLGRLEKELGVSLFDRVGRNIYLNECGQSFYAFVSPALALLENAARSVDDFKQQRLDNLVLGSVSQTYLQDAIMAFKRRHPDIRISQFTIEPENADRELNQNDFDFLLIPKYLDRPDFIQEVLYEDRFALALNTSHPLADQTEVRLADLKDESFISLPKGYAFRDFTDQICLAAGFTPCVAMECFHCQMLDLISAGLGVALVPESFRKKCLYNHTVKVLPLAGPPVIRPMLVSYKKARYMTKAARAFLEFLHEYYTDQQAEDCNECS